MFDFSVSATTRDPRDYEVNGKDYYFLSAEEFRNKVENEEFAEWEEVYENQYYGTLKSEIERIWALEKHIIFDIDVKGAKNIKKLYKKKCLSIFVRPPSLAALIERLKNRSTESEDSLKKRIKRVRKEMKYENKFDVVVVNDLLEVAFIEAEHLIENFIFGKLVTDEEVSKLR
jgi:guanylate kinase